MNFYQHSSPAITQRYLGVSSYEEEIQVLKKWLSDRLSFLDKNIDNFGKDFQPHIQKPTEIKPQFNGGFPF